MSKRIKLGGDSKKESPLRRKLKSESILKPAPQEVIPVRYVSSGSWIINLSLTNDIESAYPVGRVINIVGDYSSGKTLLACEVVNAVWYICHKLLGLKVKIIYDEPEAAFDMKLAAKFNMPLEHIIGLKERLPGHKASKNDFQRSRLIENVYENINILTETENKKKADEKYDIILYVLDSLDLVSDAREIKHIAKKGVGKQDYGGGKAKVLSQMFRTCIQSVEESNILFLVLSQVRSNFGAMFGPKYTRAGGKALDHACSQIIWLREVDKIKADNGMTQGMEVEIKIDKNKVCSSRYNQFQFSVLDGYGVDNVSSAANYLWDTNGFERSGNYIIWNDKKLYRSQLINQAIEDKPTEDQLKALLQQHWLKMVDEAAVKRPAKWGN